MLYITKSYNGDFMLSSLKSSWNSVKNNFVSPQNNKILGKRKFFGPNKVKITWINGVGNDLEGSRGSAALINQVFEDTKVHLYHNPTNGTTYDLMRAAGHFYGISCREAKELADHLRSVLKTAEKVLHVAHSHGGIITLRAIDYLTPEERARIDVVIVGSPVLIKEGFYRSVRHLVSDRDQVPCFHSEVSKIVAGKKSHETVTVLSGDTTVFMDHAFASSTYQKALKSYAAEYLNKEYRKAGYLKRIAHVMSLFFHKIRFGGQVQAGQVGQQVQVG